jgi:glycosyltransferase involved in cell wall biosynthesis
MPSISYAITACNEHVELKRLLELLHNNIRPMDEIVIQLDSSATNEIKQLVEQYNVGTEYEFHRIFFPLNNDFAAFKNNLSNHCTRDYIFQVDADEYPHPMFLENLPKVLTYNPGIEVLLVPRINTVEGLTEEHIRQWGWNVNEKGWVNFPDYQWRIWKNNREIKWINKVHERLDGFGEYSPLPQMEEYCLFHPKDIKRQERQNQFYNTL